MSVADPGFPGGGCANFLLISPKKCMKMKKFWASGGLVPIVPPLRSATACYLVDGSNFPTEGLLVKHFSPTTVTYRQFPVMLFDCKKGVMFRYCL